MTYKIVYSGGKTGKLVSNNQFYSAGHWAIRSALKNKWIKIYSTLQAQAGMQPFKSFYLRVLYNSKHDIDNCCANVKFFADAMKGVYVKDDGPEYFKGFSIERNTSLPKNTIEFYVEAND